MKTQFHISIIVSFLFLLLNSHTSFSQITKDYVFMYRLHKLDSTITEKEIQNNLDSLHFLSPKKQSLFYVVLGDYYSVRKDFLKASKYYYQLFEHFNNQPSDDYYNFTKARAHNGLAVIYSNSYQNKIAIRHYKKAIQLLSAYESNNGRAIISIYNNLATIYYKENINDSIFSFLNKGIALSKKLNITPYQSYLSLSFYHKNIDSALYYSNKAKLSYDKFNIQSKVSYYRTRGAILLKKNNLFKADGLLEISQSLSDTYNYTDYPINVIRGKILILKNQIDEGIALISDQIPYLEKENNFISLEKAYSFLEQTYLKQNDYKEAFHIVKQRQKNDSLFKLHKKLKQKEGLLIYNNHIKHLEKEKKSISKTLQFYIIGLIILLLFLSGVIYYIYRKKRKQHNTSKKLLNHNQLLKSKIASLTSENQQSHQELLFKTLLLDERQSFLNELIKTIKQAIHTATSKREKDQLQNIHKQLRLNLKNTVATEFEFHFEKVHPNFFQKLHKIYPNLTKKDVRLAALIKLNLDTKEISDITKQSITAINTAKSRLKSKLELQKEDSLYNYIQNI
ncbi:helix-turn-helix transcriptional regulator [Aquimarina rhabdastrellae]